MYTCMLGEYIHIIWGISKDFGASGIRAGALFSHNARLLRAMGSTTEAMQVRSTFLGVLKLFLPTYMHTYIHTYIHTCTYFCKLAEILLFQVSSFAQFPLSQMLSDREFLNTYIATNRQRLFAAYTKLTNALNQLGIRFVAAKGRSF